MRAPSEGQAADMVTVARLVAAVAARPRLWGPAIAAARAHAPLGWWRRPPFLPLPDHDWLAYRMVTAYGGDGSGAIEVDDLITWLDWRHRFPR